MHALLATLVLTVVQMALGFLAPASARAAGGGGFGLWLASNALIASLLVGIAQRLRSPRKLRPLWLWAVWGGVQANCLLDAVLFDIGIPRGDLAWVTLDVLAVSAVFCAFVGLVLRPSPAQPSEEAVGPAAPGAPAWWRLGGSILIYEALYFTAGRLAWPYLKDFYTQHPMPSTPAVAALQVVRGLGFALVVLLLVRRVRLPRSQAMLLAGLTLSLLGGVAPLLMPNPYLPDAVRLTHLVETGVSNFVFGCLAGWLLGGGRRQPNASSYLAVAT
jgi:hypothetical protein